MKRTLLVLLVALGASGAVSTAWVAPVSSGSTTGSMTPDSPVASAPQGTTTAQENATEYPPGLSAEGVTDPLAFADAHRATLRNTSYTVTATYTMQRPNGTVITHTVTATRVAPGGSSYYAVLSASRSNESRTPGLAGYDIAVWANETVAVTARQDGDGDPTYRRTTRDRAPFQVDRQWELLYSAVGTTDTAVVQRFERGETTLFQVASTGRSGSPSAHHHRSRYGFVAVVDADGVVRSFQQRYRTTFRDRPAVVSRTVQVTAVGNTTVERPDWYGQAVANATETTTA
ncbi:MULTISPECIES: hypothetical protein [Halorussus]|uniref:hypothetical protein n=1 Tax=Halorussus TaxID=1070314 RepID=UPI000E2154B3|nr:MULTISPECIES: hypothetical protein [Halorussus]NHN61471.1 hypothetical protein [Halorussus sp. JP-T4]